MKYFDNLNDKELKQLRKLEEQYRDDPLEGFSAEETARIDYLRIYGILRPFHPASGPDLAYDLSRLIEYGREIGCDITKTTRFEELLGRFDGKKPARTDYITNHHEAEIEFTMMGVQLCFQESRGIV